MRWLDLITEDRTGSLRQSERLGPPIWPQLFSSNHSLFDTFPFPGVEEPIIRQLHSTLADDVSKRVRGGRRDYRCDLACGSVDAHESTRGACRLAALAGRVNVVFILDGIQWLGSVLAAIASLLETNGGGCDAHGAFHFHLVAPAAERERVQARLQLSAGDAGTPRLAGILSVHALPTDLGHRWVEHADSVASQHTSRARDKARLHRPSNYARFELARVLPRSIAHALYLDGDVLAVHGPFADEKRAPLKRSFHRAVEALRDAERQAPSPRKEGALRAPVAAAALSEPLPSGSLRSAMAAVPVDCSAEEFASEFVARQFRPNSTAEARAWRWAHTWARERADLPGLCFNAGVFVANLPVWRRLRLPQRLRELALSRTADSALHAGSTAEDGPAQALWSAGTQRPMQLLFGGHFVHLPPNWNIEGCGASGLLSTADYSLTPRARAAGYLPTAQALYDDDVPQLRRQRATHQDAHLRLTEFGKQGGLLHFTGHGKPWRAFTRESRPVLLSRSGVRPCAFATHLFPQYLLLADCLLAGDARVEPGVPWDQLEAAASAAGLVPASATSGRADLGRGRRRRQATAWSVHGGTLPGSRASTPSTSSRPSVACAPLEHLCPTHSGLVTSHLGTEICLSARCGVANASGCSQRPGGQRKCCAKFIHKQATPCCLTTDSACVLPSCGVRSGSLCLHGVRVRHPSQPGPQVCVARTCAADQDPDDVDPLTFSASWDDPQHLCASRPGGLFQCCSRAIKYRGQLCCHVTDTGCVLPECAPPEQQCSGGIRARNGSVCLPHRCGTAQEYGCASRIGGKRKCCATHVARPTGSKCCLATDTACRIWPWSWG